MKIKNFIIGKIIVITILIITSLVIGALSSLTYLESFRIIFGSVYVLFVPGFIISYIFFPETNKHEEDDAIEWLERIALSFALSIAVVPLTVFYLNLVGLKINLLNSFLTILGIIIISLVIIYIKNTGKHRKV